MGNRLLQFVARRPERGGILLVDDDQYLRSGLHLILSEGGYEKRDRIFEAPDGETALQLAFRHSPDVVILDFRMPGMDGDAIARGLRAMLPDARIIMFSGYSPTDGTAEADVFIEKPQIEALLRAVADALGPPAQPPELRVVGDGEREARTGS